MQITIRRHQAYDKFIVTIENNFNIMEFTLYDMNVIELAQFIKEIIQEEE
jgi:hypothetical protein